MDIPPFFLIFLANLALGFSAGVVMHRSDYCIAGMFRDLFLFRNSFMLRTLALAIVVSMILFELSRRAGWLLYYPFPLIASPTLANVVGGFVFGVGMVLAGGCVVGTLYKMGGGSVLSTVAFFGLIIGSGVYAEIHPLWAAFIKETTFLPGRITIPQASGLDPGIVVLTLVVPSLFLFTRWHRQGKWTRVSKADGYLQPWVAACLLALLGLVSYVLMGMPLGITTAYAKMAAFGERIVATDHVNTVVFFQALPLKYTLPMTATHLEGGGGPYWDAIAVIQLPVIGGIILGAACSAIRLGEFKLYYRVPPRQYASVLAGGIILALGSRMTPGCNVWHLMGGIPLLAMSSMLFLLGLLPGAWMGSKILSRFVVQ